jgi:hypothetical protein
LPQSTIARHNAGSSSVEIDFRERVARAEAVLVVGAGVSVAATAGDPVAGWRGLLEHGVDRCAEVASVPTDWSRRAREEIHSGDIDDLLVAAEKVTQKLGGTGGGEYARWLRETVGRLKPTAPGVVRTLIDLDSPILTTNYDTLIEQVSGLETVTWRDGVGRVQRLLSGDEPGVLHLHGSWRVPQSVVLGIRSYDDIVANEVAQAVQQAVAMMKSLVFVGFGAGLADPNF